MATPTGERLKAVETNLDNLTKMVEKLDGKFDAVMSTFVTQAYLQERLAAHETKIAELRKLTQEAKRRGALATWLTSTGAAIFAVILTILIQSFFSNLDK